MHRSRTLAAIALAGTTLLAPTVAGASYWVTASVDHHGGTGHIGQSVSIDSGGCLVGPGQGGWVGQFVSAVGDPLTSPNQLQFIDQADSNGDWSLELVIPEEAEPGTHRSRWFCAAEPVTSIDDEAMLLVSPEWTFTIQDPEPRAGRKTAGAGRVTVSVDPDALPAVDRMGIHGEVAAKLKDRVDARRESLATAHRLMSAFLNRQPERAGLAHWSGQVEKVGPAATAEQIAKAAEFRLGRGALSSEDFVDALYRDVLGRSADADGRAYWVDRLESGSISRAGMVLHFATSAENVAATEHVTYAASIYQRLSTVTPTQAQVDAAAADLAAGKLKVQVIEEVAIELAGVDAWR